MSEKKTDPKKKTPVIPDMELWREISGTIRPLNARQKTPKSLGRKTSEPPARGKESLPRRDMPPASEPRTGGLETDLGVNRALKQKKFAIDAKIDLHGMTEKQAHATLAAFLNKALARQLRTLLIITGKGDKGKGVIKTNAPRWIETSFADHVLGMTEAPPDLGGSGAFLLRLRKR